MPVKPLIVSICENRGREVCLAAMQSERRSELDIYVFADSHSYSEALGTLQGLAPDEVLLHDGTRDSVLARKVEALSGSAAGGGEGSGCVGSVVYISRMYFDQDAGATELARLVVGAVDADLVAKYTVCVLL